MFDIKEFKAKYKVLTIGEKLFEGGIKLELSNNMTHGVNELTDITWYKYKIKNPFEVNGVEYHYIHMMFFSINENIRKEAEKYIIEKNVSKAKRPHIDSNSGNIHPTKEYVVNATQQNLISQLVLCIKRDKGSNGPSPEKSEYKYDNVKACYYPLIENNENELKNDDRYKLLKELWDKIPEDMKSKE